MEDKVYTLEEAASLLGISPHTLKARINRGQLSAVQVPFGNKRYKLGLSHHVLGELLAGQNDGNYQRLWAQYLQELKSGRITRKRKPASPTYVKAAEQFMGLFWRNLNQSERINSIHAENLDKAMQYYQIDEAERRDYHASKSNIYDVVTGFMRLLIREGYKSKADLLAMRELKPGKRFSLKKEIYTLEEVQTAIETNELWTKGRSDYDRKLFTTLIALYAYAGLRKMEPAMLTMDKIQLERGYFLAYGKGGVEDTVLILPALEPILREWLKYRRKDTDLLLTSSDGTPLTETCIQTRFERFEEAMGNKVRPHDLRRTFATLAAADGMPTPLIQKQLRHRQLRTTEGYMMLDDQHLLDWGRKQTDKKPLSPNEQKSTLPASTRR